MQPHRSSALDGAAAALTVACTRVVAVPLCARGLISLTQGAARGRLSSRAWILWAAPRTLKVATTSCRCASTTIRLCESASFVGLSDSCQSLKEHVARDCCTARPILLKPSRGNTGAARSILP